MFPTCRESEPPVPGHVDLGLWWFLDPAEALLAPAWVPTPASGPAHARVPVPASVPVLALAA